MESPAGTSVTIASGEADGTYSHTLSDFNGESLNGGWMLWIEDSFGDGGHQALNITVTFYYDPPPANDAGISAVSNPGDWVEASSTANPIEVTINNYGTDNLVSADVVWELLDDIGTVLDNGSQAWSGDLVQGDFEENFNIGAFDAPATTGFYTLKVYSENPNGVADENNLNDTIYHDFGIYSAGACANTLTIYDSYGDGWNGNAIDVYVGGILMIENATILSGQGPETYTFYAATGETVNIDYDGAGSWQGENYWWLANPAGIELISGQGAAGGVTQDAVWFCSFDNDIGISDVTPTSANYLETIYPSLTIFNNSFTNVQDDFTIDVSIDDGSKAVVYTSTKAVTNANMLPAGDTTITMEDMWLPMAGEYTMTVTVTLAGDDYADNDQVVQTIFVADGSEWIVSPETMDFPMYMGSGAFDDANDMLFVLGGNDAKQKISIYDAVNDSWSNGTDIPGEMIVGSAAYANGFVYAQQGNYLDVVWSYEVATDTWNTIAPLPAGLGWGEMAYDETHNGLYVVAGYDGTNAVATVYFYDIATDTWSAATDLPEARVGGSLVNSNGTLYYIAGADPSFALTGTVYKGVIDGADPNTITWSTVAPYPMSVYKNHAAPFGDGKIIGSGGDIGGWVATDATYIYSIATDTWEVASAKTTAALGGAEGTLEFDNKLNFIVATGYNGGTIDHAEKFVKNFTSYITPDRQTYYVNAPEDMTTTAVYDDATGIASISDGTDDLVLGTDYTVNDFVNNSAEVTINASYLEGVVNDASQDFDLFVNFDNGITDIFTLETEYLRVDGVTNPAQVDTVTGVLFADLVLPTTVTIQLNNGEDSVVNVTWLEGSYDLNTPGVYTLQGVMDLGTIANPYNVETELNVGLAYEVFPVPYFEDFENAGNIPLGWENAAGDNDDEEDWEFVDGAIGTGTHGATFDHTTGSGYFAGVDDSSPNDEGDSIIMYSPVLDIASSGLTEPKLTFWYWNTDNPGLNDTTELYVQGWNGTAWDELLVVDQPYEEWTNFVVDLTAYAAQSDFQLRFLAVTTDDYHYDPSLDDVYIGEVYDVTFNITKAINSDLLEGADVTLGSDVLTTDATGSVTYTGVMPGDYDYTVTATQYLDVADMITVDQDLTIDIAMDSLYVIAFTADDGTNPLQDVVIDYTDGGDIMGQVTTDVNGEAFVDAVPNGNYSFSANLLGYQTNADVFDVTNDTAFVNIPMATLPATFSFVTDYPSGIDFSSTLWGYSSEPMPVTFSNIGQGTITIDPATDIYIDGPNAADFTLDNLEGTAILNTGDDSTIFITFDPSALGAHTATLHIEDNITKVVHDIAINAFAHDSIPAPIVDDFEDGTWDDWNLVQNDQFNQWFIGEASDDAGNLSAFVSNDGGINNSYTIDESSVSHFFMDVIIPDSTDLGDIKLNFEWKGLAEGCCDYVNVYLTDPATNPVAGVMLPGADQIGVSYNDDTEWQFESLDVPVAAFGTTKRLVFSWKNDGSIGDDPALAIDNIFLGTAHTDAVITSLDMVEVEEAITIDDTTIYVQVSPGSDLGNLTPMFETLNNGTVSGDGVTNDFSDNVVYTVTAEDGITTQEYTIMVYSAYRVTFNVTDGVDPFPGVDIDFDGEIITTDTDGIAFVDVTNYGDYPYTIEQHGYEYIYDFVTIVNDDVDLFIDLVLRPNPYAMDVTPDSNAIDVGVQPTITCEFDQPIWENDLNMITVEDGTGPITGVTSEILPDGVTVQISTPQLDWTTNYVVTIPSGTVTNTIKNNEDIVWSFDTRDVSTPVPAVYYPDANAVDIVLPIADITCQFDQTVSPTTNLDGVTLEDDGGNPITITTTLVNDNTVTIAHPALSYNTTYTVNIPSNTLTNGYLVNDGVTWDFSTVMTTEPLVITNTPANGATDIALGATVSVEFDQDIIEMGDLANITVADATGPLTGVTATINGAVIEIAHPAFEYYTAYTVTVPASTVSNIYGTMGNAEEVWTFTTLPNNDATLMDLTVDGTTVNGFNSGTYVYNVVLPAGTTTVPTVDGTPTDPNATYVVTPAAAIPGTTEVEVTAQDGTTILTYQVNFTAPNDDATLSDLTVDGTTVTGFDPSILAYTVDLPHGTTTVPTVDAVPNDVNATYIINATTVLPGTTDVVVTAEDGTTELTYSVTFNILPNDDATLSDLTVDGTTVTGFDPDTFTYTVTLPAGTTTIPTVDATPTDVNATYVVNDATTLPGTTDVVVTAEDGTTELTYSVVFEIEPIVYYTVTFGVDAGNGTVEATVDGTAIASGDQVAEGSAVNFTATPDAGWEVMDWLYNGDSTGITSTTVVEDPLASDITVFVIFQPEGISEISDASFINVYPNPTEGLFKVDVETNYQLTIYDFTGKVVKETNVMQGINSIDMATYPSGIYMLEFRNDNRTQSVRLFIR